MANAVSPIGRPSKARAGGAMTAPGLRPSPRKILEDLTMLFELDEEYQKLTGKNLLNPLDEKWNR